MELVKFSDGFDITVSMSSRVDGLYVPGNEDTFRIVVTYTNGDFIMAQRESVVMGTRFVEELNDEEMRSFLEDVKSLYTRFDVLLDGLKVRLNRAEFLALLRKSGVKIG